MVIYVYAPIYKIRIYILQDVAKSVLILLRMASHAPYGTIK